MIRYALACEASHTFESWFRGSDDFDAQKARGLVVCPACGSLAVDKQIMAPALARAPEGAAPQPVALVDEQAQQLRAMLRALRDHVRSTAEDVGPRFAEEARKIHYGEIEHRPIYGQADPEDVTALRDEGVDVHPLPLLPDDRN